jgi:hypothetical protein
MGDKRGRPNQLDDILLAAANDAVNRGVTLREVMQDSEELRDGRLTSRGLNFAALRLVRQGRLVRRYEFSGVEGNEKAVVRLYRYWLPQFSPANVEGA